MKYSHNALNDNIGIRLPKKEGRADCHSGLVIALKITTTVPIARYIYNGMGQIRQRYRFFYNLEKHMEIPMFVLAVIWLYLFIAELLSGLTEFQESLIFFIWLLFIVEFGLKLFLAPRKIQFLKYNWLTIISLLIPAFRVFRIVNAFRLLQSVRVINSTKIIRAITSGKRFFTDLKEAQGPEPEPVVNVGLIAASSQAARKESLRAFTAAIAVKAGPVLEDATGIKWNFEVVDAVDLASDSALMPSEFLDMASFRMAEGPYDMFNVVTDVPLISRKNRSEPGLSSPVSRINVLSTRSLTVAGRGREQACTEDDQVRIKGTLLLLHLTGHLLGLKDTLDRKNGIMSAASNSFQPPELPGFSLTEKDFLRKKAASAPDRELRGGNILERLIFHILMTCRHPWQFLKPLLSSRALLLPLNLSSLVTAAVAPALLLIFTAEIWDVGLGMSNGTAVFFAVTSIVLASFYLVRIQSLFLPKNEKRVLTEHLAVANSMIYFSIFFACVGLFLLIGILMMIIEIYVFPSGLMQTWPTLDRHEITIFDKIRLAVFISTIGVTTGALAGGLENRALLQHLALFRSSV